MLIAANRGAGQNLGFPDVCNTPAGPATVPIPYPNLALNAQATGFANKVIMRGMNALNLGSQIPMTSGDEAGVAHPTIKGASRYTTGNPKVFLEGLPAVTLTSPTTGNNMNNGVGVVAVPSAVNVFFTLLPETECPAGETRLMTPEQRQAHEARVERCTVKLQHHRGAIGIVRLPTFARDVPAQLFTLVRAANPLAGLVLDLRGNPGGDLDAAIELADDFLPRDVAIVTLVGSDGDHELRRSRREPVYAMPLALAVDRSTASAAELFVGALQAHGRGVVVGEPTFGKGSVQTFSRFPIRDRSVYETCARWLLPNERELAERGILPDQRMAPSSAVEAAIRALRPSSC
jgi:carboxyl-terminal processing protease